MSKKRGALLTVALSGLALLGYESSGHLWGGHPAASFRTAEVQRGDLRATISATGTIEPQEVVDVGAQVAGQIREFGADPSDPSKRVDYGTPVKVGTVLAKIDDAVYQAQVDQAKSQLAQAQAGVKRAEADLIQMKAKLRQTQRDYGRAQQLGPGQGNAISALDLDTSRANYEVSQSGLGVGEATIEQAKQAAAQAEAALKLAETNLGYTTIRSPVDGVIVDRRVNVGQTVVASLNAPSLFLIAKDLTRLQIWTSVNEADIGQIHAGQPVSFTVDAHPNELFHGTVSQIRLNANMTQNVVTYTVVVDTDNANGKLLPYLTANVQFEVSNHPNVLEVPNAALRWRPRADQVAPDVREKFAQAQERKGQQAAAGKSDAHNRGTLWVPDGAYVRPERVRTGISDGVVTEVVADNLAEGAQVIVGDARAQDAAGSTNPFAPQLFGGKK
jgi:HlyD family secretion protein